MNSRRREPGGGFPGRRRARRRAVQAVYQWQLAGHTAAQIIEQFLVEQDMSQVDVAYFRGLVEGVITHQEQLDRELGPFCKTPWKQIEETEKAVLRLGAFELLHQLDVPFQVVINEAVELSKSFGSTDGHSFVNGVLDGLARTKKDTD